MARRRSWRACRNPATLWIWLPSGTYVVVKRFSAKEERRRVTAGLLDPADLPGDAVGIENHLNYFHADGEGLDPGLARGLAAYLNSSIVDAYLRQFNGHTQVNATDLRTLHYPSLVVLRQLGRQLEASADEGAIERRMRQLGV